MANQQKGQDQSKGKRPPPPAPSDGDGDEQNPRETSQSQDDAQSESPDSVEIGDPVPENERTIKSRGQGETGEDEDLPSDDGSIETTSNRH
jgi:hypothetical protein